MKKPKKRNPPQIPARPAVEVFVNKEGTITITNPDGGHFGEEYLVTVHPSDVDKLIDELQRARDYTIEKGM
jgi:hypothetical protein